LNYRSICVEPGLTSFYQLALGEEIRRRLLRVGVDIRDQTRNQLLAREGSVTGLLATIDLSSASDTMSYELIRYLLPPDWFDLLTSFRSPSVTYKGSVIDLEMFSSMGNGFTFPLETLVYWSLTYAASQQKNAVSA